MDAGTLKLVGTYEAVIYDEFTRLLDDKPACPSSWWEQQKFVSLRYHRFYLPPKNLNIFSINDFAIFLLLTKEIKYPRSIVAFPVLVASTQPRIYSV